MTFKSTLDVISHFREQYPNLKLVPVGMGNTAYTLYEDDMYEKEVGELQYDYSHNTKSMFGYDYKFVKAKIIKS